MNTREAENSNFEKLEKELKDITDLMVQAKAAADAQYKELSTHYDGVKKDNAELEAAVKKHTADYAEMIASVQSLKSAMDMVKRELDAPVYQNETTLKQHDRDAAVELQRRAFVAKNGSDAEDEFKPDLENLVNLADYRAACRKMVKLGGLQTKRDILRAFSDGERKAFEAGNLDTAFFSPEILGMTVDCNIECAYLLDLYGQVSVSRSKFMYPQIIDYGAIGSYECDVNCDADLGPEGNIMYLNGKTYDFRGVFCFLKKVLEEANYDFMSFMMQSVERSYRINRNRALMVGDGVNEPLGWLEADMFKKLRAQAPGGFNHVDFRRFLSSVPIEYGSVVPIMHQNTFGYLASAVDNTGRFIFGDGEMTYSPESAGERLRISNCLPDPTADNTLGTEAAPIPAGSFIAAAANWDMAYKAVNRKPMSMEQFIGGSSKWCVKYQFGAEDGGFVGCPEAGRILVAA